ncbi:hypothetical protein TNCV_433141 [Trichonephila clavipes]|nr:hypothetical protein TNCV_433141 [Trichonephila clavipes]
MKDTNVHIKNAIASAVPTEEKFIEENFHIKMQKISAAPTVPSSFQQALTDSWSRTAVHVSKGEKRCLERPNLGVLLVVQGGTSEDLTLVGVHLVMQTRPNAPETTMS